VLAEALATVNGTGERMWEAELYRIKGTLTLQSKVQRLKWKRKQKGVFCGLLKSRASSRQSHSNSAP
jgi:hypothetical protein